MLVACRLAGLSALAHTCGHQMARNSGTGWRDRPLKTDPARAMAGAGTVDLCIFGGRTRRLWSQTCSHAVALSLLGSRQAHLTALTPPLRC
jgi:hypothetical protein